MSTVIKWDNLDAELRKQQAMLNKDFPLPESNGDSAQDHYRRGLHTGFHIALVGTAIALGNELADILELLEDDDNSAGESNLIEGVDWTGNGVST